MQHKITSPFIAFTLLCLLILAGSWLVYPEPVEGQPQPSAKSRVSGSQNVELVGQIGGQTKVVVVEGNYAYVAIGPSLMILDISNPANPTRIGQAILPDLVEEIAIVGNHAYVADGFSGLRVIDIAKPEQPIEVAYYDTPGAAEDVAIEGDIAYVADGYEGLRVINIANPLKPTEVAYYDTGETSNYAYTVTITGSYALLADRSSGLQVINIANPEKPTEIAHNDTLGRVNDLAIVGDYAYIANHDNGLLVVNIANPEAIIEVASIDTPGPAQAVTIAGSLAYVADFNEGLRIINIANPQEPTEVASIDTSGSPLDVAIAGQIALLADHDEGLRIISIANPQAPIEVGSYDTPGFTVSGAAIAGNYAYVADDSRGLRIINIANPQAPIEVSSIDTPGEANNVAIADNYAYVADGSKGLRVINIANPIAPTEVGSIDRLGSVQNLAIADNYAYVAIANQGLRVISIANPKAPIEVASIDTPDSAQDVAIAGDYAYVAAYNGGLRVINIADPEAPTAVSYYNTRGLASGVAISGNFAYVADWYEGLRVINIADPQTLTQAGYYNTEGYARDVAIKGDYAYVADNDHGLRVINIANPHLSTEVGYYDTPSAAFDVTIAGDYAYVADFNGGLFIFRFTGDATPTPSPSGTPIHTPTATETPRASHTPVATASQTPYSATATVTPDSGGAYEPNDRCSQASLISTKGIVEHHAFESAGDVDWVAFSVDAGTKYMIEALTPATSVADVVLEIYDRCNGGSVGNQGFSFTPDIRLEFEAPSTGTYYLRLSNHDPDPSTGSGQRLAGEKVSYDLSVRVLPNQASPGALILVAGRLRSGDSLQNNIHHTTDAVYQLFREHGYDESRIYYLATDLKLDPDSNPATQDVDGLPSPQNLEYAITEWARDKVGQNRALTLYLMDHGSHDRLYLNGRSQTVSPSELDSWLERVEAAVPGLRVNVIVEACNSGSFIDLSESVSQEGRVVMASTGAYSLAYASQKGAVFSDVLIESLNRGLSLYSAFEEARAAIQIAHPDQTPWLDDNGDGVPNHRGDGKEAQQRGFTFAGTFPAKQWRPYIASAQIGQISNEEGTITAEVRDDHGVVSVWAVIYKPSYVPPKASEEMAQEVLPTVQLQDLDGDGVYHALYENFDEIGEYRLVVHALDTDQLQSQPQEITIQTGSALYLPMVIR